MGSTICPTCGCSLVRLGIDQDQAPSGSYGGATYLFCCQGCADLFEAAPAKYIQKTAGLVVCPTCLAEKRPADVVEYEHAGRRLHFCGCPYCLDTFRKPPEHYLKRLDGAIAHEGVLGEEA